ncbi:MAG: hypothetical protein E6Q36_04440 [Chryseobacterium sp.]|nr:MAG: hypothetical protein E6Q36_04440 [Chryseobacterium sp.]
MMKKFYVFFAWILVLISYANFNAQCTGCTVTNPTLSGNYTFTSGSTVCFTSNATLGDVTFQNNSKICVAPGVTVIIQNNVTTTSGNNITFEVGGTLQFNQSPTINANLTTNIQSNGTLKAGSTGNNNFTFNGLNNTLNNSGSMQVSVLQFQNSSATNIVDNYGILTIGSNINIQGNTTFRNWQTINIGQSYNNNTTSTYINCGTINSSNGFNLGGGKVINTGNFNVPGGQLDLPDGSKIDNYGTFFSGGTVNNNGTSSIIYNEGLFISTNYQGNGWLKGPDSSSKKGYFETVNQMLINSSKVGPNLDFKRTSGASTQATVFNSVPTYVTSAGTTTTQSGANVSFDCRTAGNCTAPLITNIGLCPNVNGTFSPQANDDSFTIISGNNSTTSVLANDFSIFNGASATTSNVTITQVSTTNSGVNVNSSGTVTVSSGTPSGNYTIIYRICSISDPTSCDTATVIVSVPLDTDGDGIINSLDLDDDNDGILDTAEGACTTFSKTGTWSLSGSSYISTAGSNTVTFSNASISGSTSYTFTPVGTFNTTNFWLNTGNAGSTSLEGVFSWDTTPETPNDTPASIDAGVHSATISVNQPVTKMYINIDRLGGNGSTSTGSAPYYSNSAELTLQNAGFSISKIAGNNQFNVAGNKIYRTPNENLGFANPGSEANNTYGTAAGTVLIEKSDGSTFSSITFNLTGVGIEATGGDGFEIILELCSSTDTDADSIPDYLDLDSDGDSCPDAIEGNENVLPSQITANKISGSIDANGVPNLVNSGGAADIGSDQGQGVGTSQNASVNTCLDSDNDGIPNDIDLDDDNDGILDCDENGLNKNINQIFELNGNATQINSSEVQLTPASNNQAGQMWSYNKADFTKNFSISFDVYLGNNDGGADGVAIVFHNDPAGINAIGVNGDGIGARGIQNGVVLELDTYTNTFDPGSPSGPDHGQIWRSSDQTAITTPISLPNLEDGVWQPVIVNWDSASQTLSYTVNGTLAGSYTGNIVTNFFGGANKVYFGFTASTGGLNNDQRIRFSSLCTLPLETDTDNDGIINSLDLDSDGDGCPDAIEGDENIRPSQLSANRISGTVDANGVPNLVNSGGTADIGSDLGQGIGSSQNSSLNTCLDSDNDDYPNDIDLDDDNDGILDSLECPGTASFTNGSLEGSASVATDPTGWNRVTYDEAYNEATVSGQDTVDIITSTGPASGIGLSGVPAEGNSAIHAVYGPSISGDFAQEGIKQTISGLTVGKYYRVTFKQAVVKSLNYVDNTGKWKVFLDGNFIYSSLPTTSTLAYTDPNISWESRSFIFTATATSHTIAFLASGMTTANKVAMGLDDIKFDTSCDTDNDGIPNTLDLDSDNDGCADALEGDENVTAAQLTSNRISGTVDANGVPNLVNAGGVADIGSDQGQGIGEAYNAAIQSGCLCYKPAQTTGTALDTNHGITALGRAGDDNSNWPMVRKGAWTVLEAKTKGFVVNRLTDAQITAIPSADLREGMMVYNITQDCLQINIDGTATGWKCFNNQTCPD